jgi:LDH2 family malate/lactate/ureidoglycolate dehydrogenase
MAIYTADRLRTVATTLFKAAGASDHEATTIAKYSIAANLAGHDSHGVIMLPSYLDRIEKKHIICGAPFEIKQESPTTTVVDGNWGFGYVVAERAMQMTIEKAHKSNVAACTILRQSHVGRVGAYPLLAAQEGMIAIMTADSGRSPKAVAPFGGAEAKLGTNPISMAIPSDLPGPFCLDMATSAVAAGKIMLAHAKGSPIPEGWVVDKHGKPTTNPADFKDGGVLMPLGGPEGHKGYGLAAMVEILSGILPGLGFGVEPTGRHNDGVFMACFKVSALRDLPTFKKEVAEFAAYLKATKPMAGFTEVLYPGEVEYRREQERTKSGIEVEDKTWQVLMDWGKKLGCEKQLAG